MSHAQLLPDDVERENGGNDENEEQVARQVESIESETTTGPKSPAPVAAKPGARKGGFGLLAALLFVGLVICGLALIEQTRIVSSLEAEVVALKGEVETSHAALAVYQSRLEAVKGEVANLAYGVAGLIELLNQEITDEAEAEASSAEAAVEGF
jgi:hypothetical protein